MSTSQKILRSIKAVSDTFLCRICEREFESQTDLDMHLPKHVAVCKICDHVFSNEYGFINHLLGANPKKLYKCCLCPIECRSPSGLKYHSYQHTGNWPFTCKICQKGFATVSPYKKHIAEHLGQHWFKCQYCGKIYVDLNKLKRHFSKFHSSPENREFYQPLTLDPADIEEVCEGGRPIGLEALMRRLKRFSAPVIPDAREKTFICNASEAQSELENPPNGSGTPVGVAAFLSALELHSQSELFSNESRTQRELLFPKGRRSLSETIVSGSGISSEAMVHPNQLEEPIDLLVLSSKSKLLNDLPVLSSETKPLNDQAILSGGLKSVSDLATLSDGSKPLSDLPVLSSASKPLSDLPVLSSGSKPLSDLPVLSSASKPLSDLTVLSSGSKPLSDLTVPSSGSKPLSDSIVLPSVSGSCELTLPIGSKLSSELAIPQLCLEPSTELHPVCSSDLRSPNRLIFLADKSGPISLLTNPPNLPKRCSYELIFPSAFQDSSPELEIPRILVRRNLQIGLVASDGATRPTKEERAPIKARGRKSRSETLDKSPYFVITPGNGSGEMSQNRSIVGKGLAAASESFVIHNERDVLESGPEYLICGWDDLQAFLERTTPKVDLGST